MSICCHLPQPSCAEVYRQVLTGLKPGGVFLFEASSMRAHEPSARDSRRHDPSLGPTLTSGPTGTWGMAPRR